MSQDNNFHQYGYDHYLRAPAKTKDPLDGSINRVAKRSYLDSYFVKNIMNKMQSPVGAVVALVCIGALFSGILLFSYPSTDNYINQQIPIIKADLRVIKTQPIDAGGMSIAHSDSTLLANVGQQRFAQSRSFSETKRVESLLLATNRNDLLTKEQAIERAMSSDNMPSGFASNITPHAPVEKIVKADSIDRNDINIIKLKEPVTPILQERSPANILQKIGGVENDAQANTSKFNVKAASAAVALKPNYTKTPVSVKPASLDTMDYVRSVLKNKSVSGTVVPHKVEPAAGVARVAVNAVSGLYFVQLASIGDKNRAGGEWVKMQKRYAMLVSSDYRVQEANLSNGTFYRIQAGPMSKARANEICSALKAEGKLGGCLVVK